MLEKPFDQMDKAFIESLIADKVVEAKHLDYKDALPGDTDKEKNRFVEDVCAFANAAGGDILFGLRERKDTTGQKTGTPVYVGLKGLNFDQEKLRLEHIILNKVEPRISGIQFRPIEGFENGPVLIMRIPRSYNAPHMTKHDGRFRLRTDSGNYAMDVQEIRSAFIASETLPERIRQFRAERLSRIVAGETPISLSSGPVMVLHLIPLSAFGRRQAYDLAEVYQHEGLKPMGATVDKRRYSFDGVLTYTPTGNGSRIASYTILFRDGRIEGVDARIVQRMAHKRLISPDYEQTAVCGLKNYLSVQRDLGVETPLIAMLTLLGVQGYRIEGRRDGSDGPDSEPIDRNDLLSDEIIVHDHGCDCDRAMRPMLDAIANAAGLPQSVRRVRTSEG